jgi:hypothetical protein
MKLKYIYYFLLISFSNCSNAQYGCGTSYTEPCQIQIQPQQNLGQQLYDMSSKFDPYGAMRKAQMAPQQYDLEQQRLNLQQQELEVQRLELEKRRKQLEK